MKKPITVKQSEDPSKVVPTEVLAESIVTISQGMKRLREGRLNERALVLLIQEACIPSIGRDTIRAVLDGIQELETKFIKRTKS